MTAPELPHNNPHIPRCFCHWQEVRSNATFTHETAIRDNIRRNNLLRWVNITGLLAGIAVVIAYIL